MDIDKILSDHQLWLKREGGSKAILRGAMLRGANFRGADLTQANLRSADLRGADLRGSKLVAVDLARANLDHDSLRGAKLSGAKLSGAPKIKTIHAKLFEAASKDGALDMENWQPCSTTNCRAGWVVTLAGQEGAELESEIGTNAAAALIYYASDPGLEMVPDWHCSNEEAIEDMKRLADLENAGK